MILREKDGTTRFEVKAGRVWNVGRDRSADVVLPSLRVDKKHAVLDYRGPECLLSDAGSSSGTFLNDIAVHEPSPIKPGDVLRLGAYSMVVER